MENPECQNNLDQPEHSRNSITFANPITCSPFGSLRYSNLIIYILTNCISGLLLCVLSRCRTVALLLKTYMPQARRLQAVIINIKSII